MPARSVETFERKCSLKVTAALRCHQCHRGDLSALGKAWQGGGQVFLTGMYGEGVGPRQSGLSGDCYFLWVWLSNHQSPFEKRHFEETRLPSWLQYTTLKPKLI
jgi:hypothetical protein